MIPSSLNNSRAPHNTHPKIISTRCNEKYLEEKYACFPNVICTYVGNLGRVGERAAVMECNVSISFLLAIRQN